MFHPECNLSGTTKQVCECATFYYFLFTCPFFVIQKWVMQCTAYLFEIYLFTVFIGQLYSNSNSMDLGVNNVNDVCLRNGTSALKILIFRNQLIFMRRQEGDDDWLKILIYVPSFLQVFFKSSAHIGDKRYMYLNYGNGQR